MKASEGWSRSIAQIGKHSLLECKHAADDMRELLGRSGSLLGLSEIERMAEAGMSTEDIYKQMTPNLPKPTSQKQLGKHLIIICMIDYFTRTRTANWIYVKRNKK